jgi:hypothetical protein
MTDGLAVELLQHGDFDVRGGRWGLVLTAMFRWVILCHGVQAADQDDTEESGELRVEGAV